jgi:hypothetical protein
VNVVTAIQDFEASYDIPRYRKNTDGRLAVYWDKARPEYEGRPVENDDFPRYENPWANVAWQQRRYEIRYSPYILQHDLDHGRRGGDGL